MARYFYLDHHNTFVLSKIKKCTVKEIKTNLVFSQTQFYLQDWLQAQFQLNDLTQYLHRINDRKKAGG